jgi:hypothetical protein
MTPGWVGYGLLVGAAMFPGSTWALADPATKSAAVKATKTAPGTCQCFGLGTPSSIGAPVRPLYVDSPGRTMISGDWWLSR